MSRLFFCLLLSVILISPHFPQKMIKVDVVNSSAITGELISVRNNHLYILKEKVNESDPAELQKGIVILPLDKVKSAYYLSDDDYFSPYWGFIIGGAVGFVFHNYKDFRKQYDFLDRPIEFDLGSVFLGGALGLGLAVLGNINSPAEYHRIKPPIAGNIRAFARYPNDVPEWLEQLKLP